MFQRGFPDFTRFNQFFSFDGENKKKDKTPGILNITIKRVHITNDKGKAEQKISINFHFNFPGRHSRFLDDLEAIFKPDHDWVYFKNPGAPIHILELAHQISPSHQMLYSCGNVSNIATTSYCYYLSYSAQAVFNWLGCLSVRFNKEIFGVANEINIIHENETASIINTVKKDYLIVSLLQAILAIKKEKNDPYANLMSAIECLFKAVEATPENEKKQEVTDEKFISYLDLEKRISVFFPEFIKEEVIIEEKGASKKLTKQEIVIKASNEFLLKPNHLEDLTFILKSIHYLAMKKLFSQVIGQIAHDKGKYNYFYTEFDFFKFVETKLDDNNCLSFINFHENKGYLKHYAKGKDNHKILIPEMEWLFNLLDIKLEICSHEELKFTRESTEKILMPLGLHIDLQTIKAAIYAKNFWRFFSNDNKQNNNSKVTSMFDLPKDMREYILKDLEEVRQRPRLGSK